MSGGWELAYLGLGSNLGDRQANLEAAVQHLANHPSIRVLRASSLYETEPVGYTDQPWFLNAVLEIETVLEPEALLNEAKRIEAVLGRQHGPRWGPRPLDIDILLFGDRSVDTPELQIPHREMGNRLFVLLPLAELRPELMLSTGRMLADRIAELGTSHQVVRQRGEWLNRSWQAR